LPKINRLYEKMKRAWSTTAPQQGILRVRDHIGNELMNIRFHCAHHRELCDSLRGMVDEVRGHERAIMNLCVNKGGNAAAHFIKEFPGSETKHALGKETRSSRKCCPRSSSTSAFSTPSSMRR